MGAGHVGEEIMCDYMVGGHHSINTDEGLKTFLIYKSGYDRAVETMCPDLSPEKQKFLMLDTRFDFCPLCGEKL